MQVSRKDQSETSVQLTLTADAKLLDAAKQEALKHVAKNLKLQGFREGKAPASLVEKSADPATLQSEFLDIAMNRMYGAALDEEKLRPVAQPKVTVKKFVPFTELEIEAEVEVIGKIKLADYKKVKVEKPAVKVTAKDIDEVLAGLRTREAEKKDVKRAAKDGDEITIDFTGTDSKTGEAIQGADGKAYPLVLGSNTFIPGFEPELIGLKAGDEKTFDITFPADYGVAALQNRAVTFAIKVVAVKEVVEPKLDDEFAAKFTNEVRVGKLATFFAALAIFISCLGLFGLASFVAEQRTKEIGIRKVLGASVTNLWGMLSKDFVVLVIISCFIAAPVAYYFMSKWLLKYDYRTGISWWVFAASAIGALVITVLTVSFQAIKAAVANPVKSLRSE